MPLNILKVLYIKTFVHTSYKSPYTEVLVQSSLYKDNRAKAPVQWSLYTVISRGPSIKILCIQVLILKHYCIKINA